MFGKILKLKTIDSTHKFAIRLIESNTDEGCVIIAENQTDGVGRCERKWVSLGGNLFASVIKKLPAVDLGQLSFAAACAVHEAISDYLPNKDNLRLHWPNDVYYKDLKISGILIGVVNCRLIVSVGINIRSAPETEKAICIKDVLKPQKCSIKPQEMLEAVLAKMNKWFYCLEDCGFSYIKEYWLRYINEINCNVTIRNGQESLSGIFSGIDESGRLILKKNGRSLFISSGDMFVNREGITVRYE